MAQHGVNKVILIGNLGQDPDTKYMPSGDAVCNISVATSETWKDKSTGEDREKTEWHRVVLFGKIAEIADQYLKKGAKVYIEGQLCTRKWKDQSGQDRYATEVVVKGFNGGMQMLGSSGDGGGQARAKQQAEAYRSASGGGGNRSSERRASSAPPPDDGFDDDIPF